MYEFRFLYLPPPAIRRGHSNSMTAHAVSCRDSGKLDALQFPALLLCNPIQIFGKVSENDCQSLRENMLMDTEKKHKVNIY